VLGSEVDTRNGSVKAHLTRGRLFFHDNDNIVSRVKAGKKRDGDFVFGVWITDAVF
jgi:hypothetical protein